MCVINKETLVTKDNIGKVQIEKDREIYKENGHKELLRNIMNTPLCEIVNIVDSINNKKM